MSKAAALSAFMLANILSGTSVSAEPLGQPPSPNPISLSFHACSDHTGKPVRYVRTDEIEIHPWVLYAGARYLKQDTIDEPAIFYKPNLFDGMPQIAIDFTFAHECYHLKSGDAHFAYAYRIKHGHFPNSKKMPPAFEENADCDAAKRMRIEFNYTLSDMALLRPMIERTTRSNETQTRIDNIMACYSGTRSGIKKAAL